MSVEDVEVAFREAGEELVRQESGPFRVGGGDEGFDGCEEVHSEDGRISVTICRSQLPGPLLTGHIPTMPVHEFDSTEGMLGFLQSDAGANSEPLLFVHRGTLTVSYVGGDPARVERIGRALAHLSN